jgi:bacterioferritin-associated ferredoxin
MKSEISIITRLNQVLTVQLAAINQYFMDFNRLSQLNKALGMCGQCGKCARETQRILQESKVSTNQSGNLNIPV